MLLVIILLVLHVVFAANFPENKIYYDLKNTDVYFETFVKMYNKTYENELEKEKRIKIFKENLNRINEMNKNDPHSTFGINKFADLSPEEFIMKHTGFRPNITRHTASRPDESTTNVPCRKVTIQSFSIAIPEAFDWRDRILIPIKDQGACGSCWAFSTTGNVEAQYAIKYKKPITLSEQQIVDCNFNAKGCDGAADIRSAFRYLIRAGGQTTAQTYPYEDLQRLCRFSPSQARVRVSDCVFFTLGNEELIREALIKYGPLSAVLDATSLINYQRGVLSDCTFIELNHAIMIVGYGTDEDGDFWVIKNSWGTSWGEAGFARIRSGINYCGILNDELSSSIIE